MTLLSAESKETLGAKAEQIRPIRVLAFIEASWLTGPAKNLIEFARRAREFKNPSAQAEVVVATYLRRTEDATSAFLTAVKTAGLQCHVIAERFPFDPAVLRQIKEVVHRMAPDVVQSHNVKSHFLVRLSGVNREIPWIAFQHGYTWPDIKMRFYNQFDRWSLRSADQVVTVCRPFASAIERIGVSPDRICVQHNSVPPFSRASDGTVSELRRSLGIQPNTLIALAVGRLSLEKGHIDLIRAAAKLRLQGFERQFQVVVVGDGPERDNLKRAAEKLGVSDLFVWVGHRADIGSFYSIADLMVLPSHSEGSPNVLLEAFAAGLPVIATSVGGVPEIAVANQNAILIEKCNVSVLADAIKRLLQDPGIRKRLGTAASDTAGNYDPESYCRAILQLYREVLLRAEQRHRR